jgi:hypothetical protein
MFPKPGDVERVELSTLVTYAPLVLDTRVAELGLEDDTGPSVRLRCSPYTSGCGLWPFADRAYARGAVGDRAQQLGINVILGRSSQPVSLDLERKGRTRWLAAKPDSTWPAQ